MRNKTPVHHAAPWIEMTQIQAELAHDRNAIDPRRGAQALHALKPVVHDLPGNRSSRFELTDQKAIQVMRIFWVLTSSPPAARRVSRSLKPKGQRTAEKTGCHRFILSWARASTLLEDFSDPHVAEGPQGMSDDIKPAVG
jgi:hypothetical protein